jgi:hypothetical protein
MFHPLFSLRLFYVEVFSHLQLELAKVVAGSILLRACRMIGPGDYLKSENTKASSKESKLDADPFLVGEAREHLVGANVLGEFFVADFSKLKIKTSNLVSSKVGSKSDVDSAAAVRNAPLGMVVQLVSAHTNALNESVGLFKAGELKLFLKVIEVLGLFPPGVSTASNDVGNHVLVHFNELSCTVLVELGVSNLKVCVILVSKRSVRKLHEFLLLSSEGH